VECDIPVVLDSEIGPLCVELLLAGAQKSVFLFFSPPQNWKETFYPIQRMCNKSGKMSRVSN